MTSVLERFLRYVRIDTQSDRESQSCPSTAKQFNLARLLVEELQALGLQDVELDAHGYVMATLPANVEKNVPTLGLIAHMDTSPDMGSEHVRPQLVENYDGGNILLNAAQNLVMRVADFPEIQKYAGQTLVTTDGTTLLGADDKAGLAEIIAALEVLQTHPEIPHGRIRVGFTPDEEIGRGADRFDTRKFGADFAYTVDGGELGELQYENFNAAGARVSIRGRSVHPGTAKNKLINAIWIAHELLSMLPVQERPEFTSEYEGFYHLHQFNGTVEETTLGFIIRDHDRARFEAKKQLLKRIAAFLNEKYGSETVTVELEDQYYNMKEKILPVRHLIDVAEEAMRAVGVQPLIIPIRGGTDGARLSYMGLPTPNLFTGGLNFHGRYECIPVESMEKAVQVIVKIIELHAQ